MTPQDYVTTYAPKIAAHNGMHDANKLCKEVQTICGCTQDRAVKTLIATFDEALKIRDNKH